MKIYYPSYYKDFKCIADRCRHSCCVGWEIGVDSATLDKYAALPVGEHDDIISHIDAEGCVILGEGERCPFLRQDGLCRLIAERGEEYISRICREHPRFYHRVGNRVECGIGLSCEEACRVVLSSDFGEFYSLERESEELADETDYDTLTHREAIYTLLSDGGSTYRQKLERIKDRYGISDAPICAESITDVLSDLEYLDETHREIISVGRIDERDGLHTYYERFLAYLMFRHLTVAESYDGLRARLGFCLLLLLILENAMADERPDFDTVCHFARIISEEIEYSEDNTAALIFELECLI